jgi:hypothetical protein
VGDVMRFLSVLINVVALLIATDAAAQQRCEIPREARDIWRCENGFVIGPENVIIRLPIPETNPEALYNAGIEAAQSEDWRVAIAYFTAAQQRAHLVPRYMYNLGLAHARAGHEVAAISWLITYLIAEPETPHRAAIWEQITTLEASAQEDVQRIYAGAEAAVELLPATLVESFSNQGARSGTYLSMAFSAAEARDLVRANEFRRLGMQSALTPMTFESSELTRPAAIGALGDNDLAYAEQSGTPLINEAEVRTARLRRGLINQDLCGSGFGLMSSNGAWRHALCPEPVFPDAIDDDIAPIYRAAQSGSRERLRQVLSGMESHYRWGRAALTINGRGREALQLIERNREASTRRFEASAIANILLYTGPALEAEPFVLALERYDRERGWSAVGARARSFAARGDHARAIDMLEIFLTRKMSAGSDFWGLTEAHSPVALWMRWRHDARVVIAEFLIDRGRRDEGLEVMQSLDPLRQRLVAIYAQERGPDAAYAAVEAAALARSTNGAAPPPAERRRLIEDAVVVATMLPGIAYDPAWWFAANGEGRVFGSDEARQRARLLAVGAASLQRGILRAQAMYRRAGGAWGQ